MKLPYDHPKARLTRTEHKMIVATGIVACAVVQISFPDFNHLHIIGGTTINLVWLLVEPEGS